MKRALFVSLAAVCGAAVLAPRDAAADDHHGLVSAQGYVTWGGQNTTVADATSVTRDAPVTRARDLLSRARFLDEAAVIDEKSATDIASRLAQLKLNAKVARDKADRATGEEREGLQARAEDLEADVVVSEAEITFKRRTAVENRRVAHELRLRAIRLVREAPPAEEAASLACDPPFRFSADGRKIYRIECLK